VNRRLVRTFEDIRAVLASNGFNVAVDQCRTVPADYNTSAHGLLTLFTGRALIPGLWGYLPTWSKDQTRFQLSAHAETVFDKPMFRGPVRNSRCVVPVDGYIELNPRGRSYVGPHFVYREQRQPFFVAAVHTENLDGNPTVAILTRPASAVMRPFCERMPVAYQDAAMAKPWLADCIVGDSIEWLCCHAIDPRVIDTSENHESLLLNYTG
jgi:putative SOS response-associated peptidase YedK